MDDSIARSDSAAADPGTNAAAGRNCPLSYRYSPTVFRGGASARTDTLYVVGGLYGNEPALAEVLRMYDAEAGPKHLIFNGDFNWFNAAPDSFRRINEGVLAYDAIRGNVETELAAHDAGADDMGCGCAYPDWVGDDVVRHSNSIMRQLAATAVGFPALQLALAALPMWRRIDVGGIPVGVVHGDAQSLSGWGFSQEHLIDDRHLRQVQRWFEAADVRLFASSHTCLPVLQSLVDSLGRTCMIANNGAAGMPNFLGRSEGLLTRISTTPPAAGTSWLGARIAGLYIDALPIAFDYPRWRDEFVAQWPAGSPAHASYWTRITEGPSYRIAQALRIAGRPS